MNPLFQHELKSFSPVHYAACLFAPANKRDALITFYRFDAEIKRIPARVSEPMLGEIRLVWWQEALSGERTEEARLNPLAHAMLDLVKEYQLPPTAIRRLIEGEIRLLENVPLTDQREIEANYGERYSAVFQLASIILDRHTAPGAADACGHSGVAYGIACDLAFHRHTVKRAELTALGNEHLGKARRAISALPESLRAAFLPMVVVDPILQKAGRNSPDELVASPSYLASLWRMLRYKI